MHKCKLPVAWIPPSTTRFQEPCFSLGFCSYMHARYMFQCSWFMPTSVPALLCQHLSLQLYIGKPTTCHWPSLQHACNSKGVCSHRWMYRQPEPLKLFVGMVRPCLLSLASTTMHTSWYPFQMYTSMPPTWLPLLSFTVLCMPKGRKCSYRREYWQQGSLQLLLNPDQALPSITGQCHHAHL